MNPYTGGLVFIVIWWLVLFCVLPFGVRPMGPSEEGYADSAPAKPMLWRKLLATTVIAALLTGAAIFIIDSGWIQIR